MGEDPESSNNGELFTTGIDETTSTNTAVITTQQGNNSFNHRHLTTPQQRPGRVGIEEDRTLLQSRTDPQLEDVAPLQEERLKQAGVVMVSGSLQCAAIRERHVDRETEDTKNNVRGNAAVQQEMKQLRDETTTLKLEKIQLKKELASQKKETAKLRDEISDLQVIQEEYQEDLKRHKAHTEKIRNKTLEKNKENWEADAEVIRLRTQKHISTLENVILHCEERIHLLENEKKATALELVKRNQQIAKLENRCGEQSVALARERKTCFDLYTMYEMERSTFMFKVLAVLYTQ